LPVKSLGGFGSKHFISPSTIKKLEIIAPIRNSMLRYNQKLKEPVLEFAMTALSPNDNIIHCKITKINYFI